MRLLAVPALLVVLTCACTTSYTWRPARLPNDKDPRSPEPRVLPSGARPTVEQARWAHLFVFGLIGQSSVDLRDVCPGPVAERLRTGMTLPTTLVAAITLGVYTPLEHRFTCVVPPPGPLHIPRVTLEETAPLRPEEDDFLPAEGHQVAGERRMQESGDFDEPPPDDDVESKELEEEEPTEGPSDSAPIEEETTPGAEHDGHDATPPAERREAPSGATRAPRSADPEGPQ